MQLRRLLLLLALLSGAIAVPRWANATCKITNGATGPNQTVQLQFGSVNVTSTYLQPVGSQLGTAIGQAASRSGWTSETVLWTCAQTDLPNIYFLVATNGDDRVGGYWEIGNGAGTPINDGLPGVYATYFQYVGLRQTMAGVVLSRYYQKVPITSYDVSGSNILIKAKHIPPLVAELFRVSSLPPATGSGTTLCGPGALGMTDSGPYSCNQPNSYIQLSGSNRSIPFGHDQVGDDQSARFLFLSGNNGFGYGMRDAATLTQDSTCVARSATPQVLFDPISVPDLIQGSTRQASFTVQLECRSIGVTSGTSTGQTAMGIQASQNAYNNAQSLSLVNGSNGVAYLVSDNYSTDNGLAHGVGIRISSSANGNMNLIGWPPIAGGSAAAGWYPVLQGASSSGSSALGYTNYTETFTATLTRLPGLTPTAGKVNATAYILVKVQ